MNCSLFSAGRMKRIETADVPAVDEIRDGVVDAKRGSVQISADLHVVAGHDADCCLVFIIKDLPLERGTEQQHEVV